MPYVFPKSVHHTHLHNFALRLHYHLQNPPQNIKAAHEVFCKAGGYPNIYAAQNNRERQQFLLFTLPNNTTIDVLPGVPTKMLFEWGEKAWKQHKVKLAPNELSHCQQLLADIWGYAHWDDIERRSICPANSADKVLWAKTLDELAAGNVYYPWGSLNGKWMGCTQHTARDHTLVFAPPAQQATIAAQLVSHRIRQGDSILAFVEKSLSKVRDSITQTARSDGRTLVRLQGNCIPVPNQLRTTTSIDTVVQWLNRWVDSATIPLHDPFLVDWLTLVAGTWLSESNRMQHNRLSELLGSQWQHPTAQKTWNTLFPATRQRLDFIATNTHGWPMVDVALGERAVVVVDMPAVQCTSTEQLWGRMAASAFSPIHTLEQHTFENIVAIDYPLKLKPLTTCVWVNTTIDADVPGAGAWWAQSRAIGRAITCFVENFNNTSIGVRTGVGNSNTKIFVPAQGNGKIIVRDFLNEFEPKV